MLAVQALPPATDLMLPVQTPRVNVNYRLY